MKGRDSEILNQYHINNKKYIYIYVSFIIDLSVPHWLNKIRFKYFTDQNLDWSMTI